jgi:hypothetical protein
MKFLGLLVSAIAAGFTVATASIPAHAAAPILIKSCTVAKPRPMSHMADGTWITYVNLGRKAASSITFAVGYRNASEHYLRRVKDVGSFAPGVTIHHKLSLYNDVTYAGAQTTTCMPVQVQWAGGTVWMAPTRP